MISLIFLILTALQWLIIIDAVLSWVMPAEKFPRSFTIQITDPLYAPIRAILSPQRTGGIDLSPLAVLLLIHVMRSMLERAVSDGF